MVSRATLWYLGRLGEEEYRRRLALIVPPPLTASAGERCRLATDLRKSAGKPIIAHEFSRFFKTSTVSDGWNKKSHCEHSRPEITSLIELKNEYFLNLSPTKILEGYQSDLLELQPSMSRIESLNNNTTLLQPS